MAQFEVVEFTESQTVDTVPIKWLSAEGNILGHGLHSKVLRLHNWSRNSRKQTVLGSSTLWQYWHSNCDSSSDYESVDRMPFVVPSPPHSLVSNQPGKMKSTQKTYTAQILGHRSLQTHPNRTHKCSLASLFPIGSKYTRRFQPSLAIVGGGFRNGSNVRGALNISHRSLRGIGRGFQNVSNVRGALNTRLVCNGRLYSTIVKRIWCVLNSFEYKTTDSYNKHFCTCQNLFSDLKFCLWTL